MELWEKAALDIFGGIPRGKFMGLHVLENPGMPNDLVRVVDPNTGAFSDFRLPSSE